MMNAPFTLVRSNHYVVVEATRNGERVVFGQWLPLSKRAAVQYAARHMDKRTHRVIMRKTAIRAGVLAG